MKFSPAAAYAIKPKSSEPIDGFLGLRLYAGANPRERTWIYRYNGPGGGKRQIKIGVWPAMSEHVAKAEWERLRNARKTGSDPAAEKKRATRSASPTGSSYLVSDLFNDYMNNHINPNWKQKGARNLRYMYDAMIDASPDSPVSTVVATDLTRKQARDLIAFHAKRAPVQADRFCGIMAAAWKWAIGAEKIPEVNHWKHVKTLEAAALRSKGRKIAGERTEARALAEPEVGELLRWMPNFHNKEVEDVLTLYLWTGTRGAEICGMHAREIRKESDGLWWVIPKARTKNARFKRATDLRVPLVGRAEEIVRRRMKLIGKGFLFPRTGRYASTEGSVNQQEIGKVVNYHQPYYPHRPGRAILTVEDWSPHSLRRTARTLLAKLGCPVDVANAIQGHLQPGEDARYNLYGYDAQRRAWLLRLSGELERLANGEELSQPLRLVWTSEGVA